MSEPNTLALFGSQDSTVQYRLLNPASTSKKDMDRTYHQGVLLIPYQSQAQFGINLDVDVVVLNEHTGAVVRCLHTRKKTRGFTLAQKHEG